MASSSVYFQVHNITNHCPSTIIIINCCRRLLPQCLSTNTRAAAGWRKHRGSSRCVIAGSSAEGTLARAWLAQWRTSLPFFHPCACVFVRACCCVSIRIAMPGINEQLFQVTVSNETNVCLVRVFWLTPRVRGSRVVMPSSFVGSGPSFSSRPLPWPACLRF